MSFYPAHLRAVRRSACRLSLSERVHPRCFGAFWSGLLRLRSERVHPRPCGASPVADWPVMTSNGTSPAARGLRRVLIGLARPRGPIPGCSRLPKSVSISRSAKRAYPRSLGARVSSCRSDRQNKVHLRFLAGSPSGSSGVGNLCLGPSPGEPGLPFSRCTGATLPSGHSRTFGVSAPSGPAAECRMWAILGAGSCPPAVSGCQSASACRPATARGSRPARSLRG